MRATASHQQVNAFGLRAGDTVITKDSETADDIGISSFVPGDLPGVVCGYHLAIVRPHPSRVDPAFLGWCMKSEFVRGQLSARATGVTRYGLTYEAIQGALVPTNSDVRTQRRIADFLDGEVPRLERVTKSRSVAGQLARERLVSVRRQVRANAARRCGWMLVRRITRCLDGQRVPLNKEQRSARAGDIPYWGANKIVDRVNTHLFDGTLVLIGEDGAPFFDANRDVSFVVREPVWVNNHMHVLLPTAVEADYLRHMLNATDYSEYVDGSTRDKLTQAQLNAITIPAADRKEQRRIAERLNHANDEVVALARAIEGSLRSLEERKRALITAAVTGEFDVSSAGPRAAAAVTG